MAVVPAACEAWTIMDQSVVAEPASSRGIPEVRRASRSLDDAWVGGVCAGLAQHLGWSLLLLRVAFVALGAMQFVGVAAYLLLWLSLPPRQESGSIGVEAATRSGHRSPAEASKPRGGDFGTMIAVAFLGAGLLSLPHLFGIGLDVPWLIVGALTTLGLFCLWNGADKINATPVGEGKRRHWVFLAQGGWLLWFQLLVGVALLSGAGFGAVIVSRFEGTMATFLIVVLVVVGLAAIIAPFGTRLRFTLVAAREAKLVADAQADMAAHLHDSVLQTLALIQRQADNPHLVARLARRQERELREWLYGDQIPDASFAAAIKRVAAEVEDSHGVPVEVIVVGDADLSERAEAVVRAAREAILNAAKHSGQNEVDVYAEVEGTTIEVFVRDRGVGFDVESVSADRQGVRGSILDRMARHGGRARVRSTPGEGTEVRLEMRIE